METSGRRSCGRDWGLPRHGGGGGPRDPSPYLGFCLKTRLTEPCSTQMGCRQKQALSIQGDRETSPRDIPCPQRTQGCHGQAHVDGRKHQGEVDGATHLGVVDDKGGPQSVLEGTPVPGHTAADGPSQMPLAEQVTWVQRGNHARLCREREEGPGGAVRTEVAPRTRRHFGLRATLRLGPAFREPLRDPPGERLR